MEAKINGAKCLKREGARVAYKVVFVEPPESGNEEVEFYFSSVAAIFGRFAPEQVGCRRNHLWNLGVANGVPYRGRKCHIEQVWVQNSPRKDNNS